MAKHKPRQPENSPPSDSTRVEWLLDFLVKDIRALRPGELIDERDDVVHYLHGGATFVKSMPYTSARAVALIPAARTVADEAQITDALRELLGDLQARLREGTTQLDTLGRIWNPFAGVQPPEWAVARTVDGRVWRMYEGDWLTVALVSAVDLLVSAWPQLRRCAYKPCNALFLPKEKGQREMYHDPKCSMDHRAHKHVKLKQARDHKQELANAARRDKLKAKRRKS